MTRTKFHKPRKPFDTRKSKTSKETVAAAGSGHGPQAYRAAGAVIPPLTPANLAIRATEDSPTPWIPYAWLRLLNRKLVELAKAREAFAQTGRVTGIHFLIVEAPVRHGKSELGSVYLPAWWLGTFPDDRVILTGNNAELAEGFSRRVRNLLRDHGRRLFGQEIRVSMDSSAVSRWDLAAPNRGGLIAVGVGSPPTGKGAHLLVVDDPIKPLATDTPVPTPTGWTTMGDLRVGDEVFDHAGRPCKVIGVTNRYVAPRHRVWFSDGSYVDSHPDHVWRAFNRKDHAVYTHAHTAYAEDWPGWASRTTWGKGEAKVREVTTAEMGETAVARTTMRNWTIPTALPLDLPEAALPIDPYILGYWLGDGNSRAARFTVHKSDLDSFEAHVGAAGYAVLRRTECRGTYDVSVSITYDESARRDPSILTDTLQTRLRDLGVLMNKHVPAAYLRASASQRLALLRGLMDSDGGMGTGQVVFCSTEKRLADAVVELVCSLGGKVSVRSRPAANKTAWIVSGSPPFQPFALPRKAEQWQPEGQIRRRNRTVVRVEVLEETEHLCITVDSPSHLFLAGRGMVPTRNSDMQAYSEAWRESLWRWWLFSIRSRLEPGGVCVLIMSRWHSDDLVGRLLKRQAEADRAEELRQLTAEPVELTEEDIELQQRDQTIEDVVDRWEVLHLPALAEPTEETPDPLGRAPGEALCAERYDADALERLRDGPLGVGPVAFQALYQNRPAAAEGTIFKVEHFKYMPTVPLDPTIRWVRRWDLAATEKKQQGDPDWTAGVLMGRYPSGYLVIADVRRCRRDSGPVEQANTVEAFMRATAFEDQARLGRKVKIRGAQDPGAAGKALLGHYKRTVFAGFDFSGDPEGASGDKLARATPLANQVEAGNVTLVEGVWNYDAVEEFRAFNLGAHDDIVDAASNAYLDLAGLTKTKVKVLV